MNWNKHLNLGEHALFSPSQYRWANYQTDEEVIDYIISSYATRLGTALHAKAASRIQTGIKMEATKAVKNELLAYLVECDIPRNVIDIDYFFGSFVAYVNDAISFKLDTEVKIAYSDNAFGTSDAISFNDNFLRIHDYKSGKLPAHMDQLEIYAAFTCLEYKLDPRKLKGIELRIYQGSEVVVSNPDPELINDRMKDIIHKNKVASKFLYGGK